MIKSTKFGPNWPSCDLSLRMYARTHTQTHFNHGIYAQLTIASLAKKHRLDQFVFLFDREMFEKNVHVW